MLHLLYILAFTIIAFLAVRNLIRSLLTVGLESQRMSGQGWSSSPNSSKRTPHPELLDDAGNFVNEPLLVMRSVSVQEAREQLDELYKASPGTPDDTLD